MNAITASARKTKNSTLNASNDRAAIRPKPNRAHTRAIIRNISDMRSMGASEIDGRGQMGRAREVVQAICRPFMLGMAIAILHLLPIRKLEPATYKDTDGIRCKACIESHL